MIRRRIALPLVALVLTAQTVPPPPTAVPAAQAPAATSWLHAGSDIPADPAWRTGTLANGLRYAVRRNATPPNTVSVRVRIDAGALMEQPNESGWAHFLEHMAFRGTASRPDGEAVRLWQRLGATFGSDTNAATSLRSTTYKLDLPRTDAKSLTEAMGALAEMMQSATIDPRLVEIERNVINAERAARITPLNRRVQDASRALFSAGLRAEKTDVGGTDASIAGATAEGLRAFYKRWYRPERASVVIVGDADPALLETLVRGAFEGWKAVGPAPSEPDYGTPTQPAPLARTVSDPLLTPAVAVAWVTPYKAEVDTAASERNEMLEAMALRVLNQRFADEASAGGPMLGASASLSRARSLASQITLGIQPRATGWRPAVDAAFRVLNRTLAGPIDPAEIAQQVASVERGLSRAVETVATAPSAALADRYVAAVDGGDTAPAPTFYRDLFAGQRASLTPEAIQATLRTLFAPEPRLLLLQRVPVPGGDAAAAAALAEARRQGGGTAVALRAVSLDALAPPRTPGPIAERRDIAELGIERVRFANGVELAIKRTDFAKDQISVDVRVGRGLSSRPVGDAGLSWSAGVVPASGLGEYTAPEMARFAAGRQVGYGMSYGPDATTFAAGTNRKDLAEALRILQAGVERPRFDQVTLDRTKASFAASYASLRSQPGSVLGAFGTPALFGGDRRFAGVPSPAEVRGATLADVKRFWTDELGKGPVRIAIVGDVDSAAAIDAVARTFGAMPPRAPLAATNATIPPLQARDRVRLEHLGDPTQAIILLAWRTGAPLADLRETRALSLAQAILRTRLTETFREAEGGTYSPSVGQSSLVGFEEFSQVTASAQLTPDRANAFVAAVKRAVDDLAANGPTADELARAKETAVGAAERLRVGNPYWRGSLASNLDDPRQLESIRTYVSGRRAVTAGDVQALVKKYFVAAPLGITVLPAKRPSLPVIPLNPGQRPPIVTPAPPAASTS